MQCSKARGCPHRWRSFFTSGSSALYLFLYSAFYFYTKLDITKVRRAHRSLCIAVSTRATPVRCMCAPCWPRLHRVQAVRVPCARDRVGHSRVASTAVVRAGGDRDPVLFVHGDRVVLVLLPDRRNRLLCVLHLRAQDLLGRQDRLAPCHGRWRFRRCGGSRWRGYTVSIHIACCPADAAACLSDCCAGGTAGAAGARRSDGGAATGGGGCVAQLWRAHARMLRVPCARSKAGGSSVWGLAAALGRLQPVPTWASLGGAGGDASRGVAWRAWRSRLSTCRPHVRSATSKACLSSRLPRWRLRLPGCSGRSGARESGLGAAARGVVGTSLARQPYPCTEHRCSWQNSAVGSAEARRRVRGARRCSAAMCLLRFATLDAPARACCDGGPRRQG